MPEEGKQICPNCGYECDELEEDIYGDMVCSSCVLESYEMEEEFEEDHES